MTRACQAAFASAAAKTARRLAPSLTLAAVIGFAAFGADRVVAMEGQKLPAPAIDESATGGTSQTAILAGGCFWGVQGVFQHVKGVTSAVSGYAGGGKAEARYGDVSTGSTGHAESVRVTFDPAKISYGRILQIYFSVAHDPTQKNRQGPDEGTQYRSAIFTTSAEQEKIARAYIAQIDGEHVLGAPIATRIEPSRPFYPAEAYHQDFLTRHPTQGYIVANDLPKIENLKRLFPSEFRGDPVLVSAASSSN